MRMETDLSPPKCSQRQEFIPPFGSQRPGEESHTPREQPSFANHQINKKVSNFTADYSRPGNSKIRFTANSSGNAGGQGRKQRAAGVGRAGQRIKINVSLATRKIRFAPAAENNWPAAQQRGLGFKQYHQYANCNFRLRFRKYLPPTNLFWCFRNILKVIYTFDFDLASIIWGCSSVQNRSCRVLFSHLSGFKYINKHSEETNSS